MNHFGNSPLLIGVGPSSLFLLPIGLDMQSNSPLLIGVGPSSYERDLDWTG